MNNNIEMLKQWLLQRSPRERIILFALVFFGIYFIWNVFFGWPLARGDQAMSEQIKKTQVAMNAQQEQINVLFKVVKEPTFLSMLQNYKKTQAQTDIFTHNMAGFVPGIVPMRNLANLVTDILGAQGDVGLMSLKKQPLESLIPKDFNSANLPAYFYEIYKYPLEIEFHSNYFSTLAFLQRLEKLPWHIYWDGLDYKVLQYPEAD